MAMTREASKFTLLFLFVTSLGLTVAEAGSNKEQVTSETLETATTEWLATREISALPSQANIDNVEYNTPSTSQYLESSKNANNKTISTGKHSNANDQPRPVLKQSKPSFAAWLTTDHESIPSDTEKRFMRFDRNSASSSIASSSSSSLHLEQPKRFMRGYRTFQEGEQYPRDQQEQQKRFLRGFTSRGADATSQQEKRFMRGFTARGSEDFAEGEKRFMRNFAARSSQKILDDNDKSFLMKKRVTELPDSALLPSDISGRDEKRFMRFDKKATDHTEDIGKDIPSELTHKENSLSDKRFMRFDRNVDTSYFGNGKRFMRFAKKDDVKENQKRFMRFDKKNGMIDGKRFMRFDKKNDKTGHKRFMRFNKRQNNKNEKRFMRFDKKDDSINDKRFMRFDKKALDTDEKRFMRLAKKNNAQSGVKRFMRFNKKDFSTENKRFMRFDRNYNTPNEVKRFMRFDKKYDPDSVEKNLLSSNNKRFMRFDKKENPIKTNKRFMRFDKKNNNQAADLTLLDLAENLGEKHTLSNSQEPTISSGEKLESELNEIKSTSPRSNDILVQDKRFLRGFVKRTPPKARSKRDLGFSNQDEPLYLNDPDLPNESDQANKRFMRGFVSDFGMPRHGRSEYEELPDKKFMRGFAQKRFMRGFQPGKRFMRGIGPNKRFLRGFESEKRFMRGFLPDKKFMRGFRSYPDKARFENNVLPTAFYSDIIPQALGNHYYQSENTENSYSDDKMLRDNNMSRSSSAQKRFMRGFTLYDKKEKGATFGYDSPFSQFDSHPWRYEFSHYKFK